MGSENKMSAQENITICEKPDSITFDEIHELLWKANTKNREDGFVLTTSKIGGQDLQNRIGPDGLCFVALDGDKLVGTMSVRFLEKNTWYAKGKTPDFMLAGVLPEYQGKGIYSGLSKMAVKKIIELGYTSVEGDTAEDNKEAIEKYKHLGCKLVSYRANPGGDHYSVIMMGWLGKCPYPSAYISLRFHLKKLLVRMIYTPDKKKRFGRR